MQVLCRVAQTTPCMPTAICQASTMAVTGGELIGSVALCCCSMRGHGRPLPSSGNHQHRCKPIVKLGILRPSTRRHFRLAYE